MDDKNNETFVLKSVNELFGKTFNVPSFQRGYRWGKQEIEDLLLDLAEFANDKKKHIYLLQPLMVRKKGSNQYDVLDGQQRLTTLRVLLHVLKKKFPKNSPKDFFTITYSYRNKQGEDIFDNLEKLDWKKSPDHFFICRAYRCFTDPESSDSKELTGPEKNVQKILQNDQDILENIYNILLGRGKKQVKFIWYDCTQEIEPVQGQSESVSKDLEAIHFFNRFNKGKIPLTDSDLIKALFILNIMKDKLKNAEDAQEDVLRARTDLIIVQWDQLEKQFQDSHFTTFAFKPKEMKAKNTSQNNLPLDATDKPKTEITLEVNSLDDFFNFVANKKPNLRDQHPAYRYFQEKFDNSSQQDFADLWQNEVLKSFDVLYRWYNDPVCYNYVGWLVHFGTSLNDICKISDPKSLLKKIENKLLNKKEYKGKYNKLTDYIRETDENGNKKIVLDELLDDADYETGKELLHKILLLFNIAIYNNAGQKFPFADYYKDKWDLEHVASQNDSDIKEEKQRAEWKRWVQQSIASEYIENGKINENHNDLTKDELKQKLQKIWDTLQNEPADTTEKYRNFKELYEAVGQFYDEIYGFSGDESEKHDVSNIVLLDQHTNRSYHNAPFPHKLKCILKRDSEGQLILTGTKNAFLHYYNFLEDNADKSEDNEVTRENKLFRLPKLMLWTEQDRQEYRKGIRNTLKKLFTEKEQPNE